jgi:hypothetical protein
MGKFNARESVLEVKAARKILKTPQYEVVEMKKGGFENFTLRYFVVYLENKGQKKDKFRKFYLFKE